MSTLAFYAEFVASKVGLNSLAVTWDIERITRADGTRSALVTAGATSITIGRRGLYGYLLSGADTSFYDYIATAITADATVDQKEVAALWTMYEADVLKIAGATAAVPGAAGGLPVLDANLLVGADTIRLDGATEPLDNLVLAFQSGGLFAKLDTTLELDGAVYRFTLNALEQAPDSGLTVGETGDAVLDEVVEGDYTMRQLLRIMLAALAGKSSGGGTSTITFRDVADSKNRIAATVGGTGNRTAITLDGS